MHVEKELIEKWKTVEGKALDTALKFQNPQGKEIIFPVILADGVIDYAIFNIEKKIFTRLEVRMEERGWVTIDLRIDSGGPGSKDGNDVEGNS